MSSFDTPAKTKAAVPEAVPSRHRSPGQPLTSALRREFEPAFGCDFGAVRIHADDDAAAAARDRRAAAFTRGADIYFGRTRFAPTQPRGRSILAHELAHVAQTDARGLPSAGPTEIERDARRAVSSLARGERPTIRASHDASGCYCLGDPESVPDVTFVAQPLPSDNGFIQSAIDYHRDWGFNPQVVPSASDVVTRLSAATTHIGRMRLVSHANVDNIFLSLFTGGVRGIRQPELAAFGFSDTAGLETTMQGAGTDPFFYSDLTNAALSHFRSVAAASSTASSGGTAASPLLDPLGLAVPASTASGDLATFIRRALELRLIDLSAPSVLLDSGGSRASTVAEQLRIKTAERTLLDAAQSRVVSASASTPSPITAQSLDALKAAIASLSLADLGLATMQGPGIPQETLTNLAAANTALAAGFRGRLDVVKGRFDASSAIDVRGCRLGQNPDYMRAVQCYFGRSGDVPEVTAPEWFQSFPSFGYQAFSAESQVDGIISGGISSASLSATDVTDALQLWGGLTGSTAQLAFWITLFAGDATNFAALGWRAGIPALQMESEIDAVRTGSMAQALRALQHVFNVPASTLPNASAIATLASKQAQASGLLAVQQTLQALSATRTPDPAQLQAAAQQLAQLQQQIAPPGGGASATAPSTPTAAQMQAQAQALVPALNAQLAALNPLLAALAAKASHANAPLRFYLNLGFVLPAQSSSSVDSISLLAMDPLANRAIGRWLHAHWRGTVPGSAAVLHTPTDISTTMRRRYSALSDAHQATQVVFAPTPAYMSHIVRLRGGSFTCTAQGSNAPVASPATPPP